MDNITISTSRYDARFLVEPTINQEGSLDAWYEGQGMITDKQTGVKARFIFGDKDKADITDIILDLNPKEQDEAPINTMYESLLEQMFTKVRESEEKPETIFPVVYLSFKLRQ